MLMQAIMEAEVTEQVGAGSGERAPERLTQRNGHRPRPWIPGQARWAYAFPISVKELLAVAPRAAATSLRAALVEEGAQAAHVQAADGAVIVEVHHG